MTKVESPTVLVTGATDGIGREAARQLLARGARVILHGRDAERLGRTAFELEREAGERVLAPVVGDFARLSDVRAIAADLERRSIALDVLVNNAGVFMNERVLSVDGFEMTWAVNHLAPLLLTHLLLAAKTGGLSRIVNVASDAHARGHVDAADPGGAARPFDRIGSYAGSKLANVLVTVELSRRLAARGVTVVALHPGVVSTKLLTEGFGATGPDSVESAAARSVALALGPPASVVSGRYYSQGREARTAPVATDLALVRRFYEASVAAVGATPLPDR